MSLRLCRIPGPSKHSLTGAPIPLLARPSQRRVACGGAAGHRQPDRDIFVGPMVASPDLSGVFKQKRPTATHPADAPIRYPTMQSFDIETIDGITGAILELSEKCFSKGLALELHWFPRAAGSLGVWYLADGRMFGLVVAGRSFALLRDRRCEVSAA